MHAPSVLAASLAVFALEEFGNRNSADGTTSERGEAPFTTHLSMNLTCVLPHPSSHGPPGTLLKRRRVQGAARDGLRGSVRRRPEEEDVPRVDCDGDAEPDRKRGRGARRVSSFSSARCAGSISNARPRRTTPHTSGLGPCRVAVSSHARGVVPEVRTSLSCAVHNHVACRPQGVP
ncbi:hypothetical protein BD413DRAFT_179226 [Trametes elegans]|nr:hypothetical protein BD413DRAFT_179226 [Trametes elegans]